MGVSVFCSMAICVLRPCGLPSLQGISEERKCLL
jgi:hypothetical protein